MFDAIKNFGARFVFVVLIAVICLSALFVLLAFLRIGFIYWIYGMVDNWVTGKLGFDYYVSNLIASAFTSVFALLLPSLFWFILLGKKQARSIGFIVGTHALMCVAIYTIGSGVCFDRRTGKPLCYYADTTQGRVWSYTPGNDPISGKPFQLYTRDIKEAEDSRKISTKPTLLPQSRVTPVYNESNMQSIQMVAPVRQYFSLSKSAPPPTEKYQQTENVASQTKNRARDKGYDLDLELERIRQEEETHHQIALEKERREGEERRHDEDVYARQQNERQRFEREQKAAQERAALQDREREIEREREELARRDVKESQKR